MTRHIAVGGDKTLAEWQSSSGKDAHSKSAWFNLSPGDSPNSSIFYNDTPVSKIVDLGTTLYKDLDQNSVYSSLTLPPYRSKILIEAGQIADLALTMSAVGSTDTVPGLPVTYTIRVENQGGMIASQIVLTHTHPAEISGPSWQASMGGVQLHSGTRYTWDLPNLSPGASLTITITGQYIDTLTSGVPLLLAAEVTATPPEGPAANNRAVLLLGEWQAVYMPFILR